MDSWNESISRCNGKEYNEFYVLLRQVQSYCGAYRTLYRVLIFISFLKKIKVLFYVCICILLWYVLCLALSHCSSYLSVICVYIGLHNNLVDS